MLLLVAIWALAEAVVFFVVADVPIMALGLRAGVRKALIGALVAAVVAALGGLAVFWWAASDPAACRAMIEAVPGISPALVTETEAAWRNGGALAMLTGSFSGVPYKIFAYAAGAGGGIGAGAFAAYSILARLPRFALVALVSGWVGPRLIRRFGPRRVWAGFVLAWTAFYAVYWSIVGF